MNRRRRLHKQSAGTSARWSARSFIVRRIMQARMLGANWWWPLFSERTSR